MKETNRRLSELPLLLIDIQATGMRPGIDAPFELAWWRQGSRTDEIESISMPVPLQMNLPQILRHKGIQRHPEPEVAVAPAIAALHAVLEQSVAIVTHYARFESAWLGAWYGSDVPPLVCLYEMSRRLDPALPSHTLTALAGKYGTGLAHKHCARHHVEAIRSVWREFLEFLSAQGIASLPDVLKWINTPTLRQRHQKRSYGIERDARLLIPAEPGVYRYLDAQGRVLYVGKATSLRERVNSYFRRRKGDSSAIREMLTCAVSIEYTVCASALHSAVLECREIQRLDPPCNKELKNFRRNLYWLSRDLDSDASMPSLRYRVGPWSEHMLVEFFCGLCAAWFDGNISGINDFCVKYRFGSDGSMAIDGVLAELKICFDFPKNRRILLARAIKFRRLEFAQEQKSKQRDAGSSCTISVRDDGSADQFATTVQNRDTEHFMLGLLKATACAHIKSMRLKNILSRKWYWGNSGATWSFAVNEFVDSVPVEHYASITTASAWDLASVIDAELARLKKSGCLVRHQHWESAGA